jgi:CRISPR-associated protein Cas2
MERWRWVICKNEIAMKPSSKKSWYLVLYDVHDEKRLRLVSRHLEGYGVRVQYSVFRCRLNQREVERLKWELSKIMDGIDELMIVGLCEKCADKVIIKGMPQRWSSSVTSYEVL